MNTYTAAELQALLIKLDLDVRQKAILAIRQYYDLNPEDYRPKGTGECCDPLTAFATFHYTLTNSKQPVTGLTRNEQGKLELISYRADRCPSKTREPPPASLVFTWELDRVETKDLLRLLNTIEQWQADRNNQRKLQGTTTKPWSKTV